MKNKTVNCQNINISNSNKICLIAGPCQLETEQHALDIAGEIKNIADEISTWFSFQNIDAFLKYFLASTQSPISDNIHALSAKSE